MSKPKTVRRHGNADLPGAISRRAATPCRRPEISDCSRAAAALVLGPWPLWLYGRACGYRIARSEWDPDREAS